MAEDKGDPWLTIIGLGEDGPDGLSLASRAALAQAEVVMGPARHLSLLVEEGSEHVTWPVPFADGVALLERYRGRRVVVLTSGDPFWFGAGRVLAEAFGPGEWIAFPGVSTFALMAAELGWGLEDVTCLGLHAAPLSRLRPHLCAGARALVLLRDGAAVGDLAAYLDALSFGDSQIHVMEALGGPRARVRSVQAAGYDLGDVAHPVAVALDVAGSGIPIGLLPGRADAFFDHDGQITKSPVRALTLAALAPSPGERLWDIGLGAGSVAIEWLLAHPSTRATGFETHAGRVARARANALAMGVDRLHVVEGRVPEVLTGQPLPDAVFVGGGVSDDILRRLWSMLSPGTRIVANAVTLETEALLSIWHAGNGGDLLRIELAKAQPLGARRGWKSAYPVVQWRAVR